MHGYMFRLLRAIIMQEYTIAIRLPTETDATCKMEEPIIYMSKSG
jgi:hypothetical protein